MNPLIGIAAAVFPDILRLIASDRQGDIARQVISSVQAATGTDTPAAARQALEDPATAAALQARLAEIALEQHKATLAAQLAADANDLRRDEVANLNTFNARQTLERMVNARQPVAYTPSILSYIVVLGFFALVFCMVFGKSINPNQQSETVQQIINIAVGALATAFATVINFWLGSSLGSRNKDFAMEKSVAVEQVKSVTPATTEPPPATPSPPTPPAPRPAPAGPATPAAPSGPTAPAGPPPSSPTSPAPTAPSAPQAGGGPLLRGKMSTFGGPADTGVSPREGLALVEPEEVDVFEGLFLADQPPGTSGLARRLDPSALYVACRWDYKQTPRSLLQRAKVIVTNPATGKSAEARPVDWGPSAGTGRVADLSPGLAELLGLATDDVCQITLPSSVAPAGLAPAAVPASDLRLLSQAQIEAAFGRFRFSEAANGAITILGNWTRDHIVEVAVPELAPFQRSIECHTLIAQPLKDAFAEVAAQGLLGHIQAWDGLFVPRHKSWDPSRSLSSHSWGIAFDINARWNGYGKQPTPAGRLGSVIALVPIFEKHGFYWGGRFSGGSIDGMHFEYCRTA
ncbi:hypothetical protein GCM10007301_41020 [Azorhizobium oxalatiphilum]|uniref:Peptidase M15C domain-containing protein n=1 Tax=Azorhizobium oxalatiphilum TaxID=980631 RepID=A0A917FEV2_9HYPH|nr:M15 family metallopeptidase [Azorhizobium oxalatiphilum]GGF76912.1 hypothetical protein GCM10007301_41020 [Azorhizobium oxalatiphilum]